MYFLQNITKIKTMYSAGCPKAEAVCSSDYHEDTANIFCRMSYRWSSRLFRICWSPRQCFTECCEGVSEMFLRQSSIWRCCVREGTVRMEAGRSSEYSDCSCRMFLRLTWNRASSFFWYRNDGNNTVFAVHCRQCSSRITEDTGKIYFLR